MNKQAEYLFSLREESYRAFTAKIVPGIEEKTIIGVRIPFLRKYAASLIKTGDYTEFLNSLPHTYYEENLLHALIISRIKDYDEVIRLTDIFLPYIDNWAVCDSFNPACFKRNKERLIADVERWLSDEHIYTRRFAVDMLMGHFLDDDFDERYLESVLEANSEDYYMKMVVAWYFATALAKQYNSAVRFIEERKLDKWTHNKTIQKANESLRIDTETKEYLKSLKIK